MTSNQPAFFETFRISELVDTEKLIRQYGGIGCRILEIGSGTGWQAKALSEMGYKVEAIDLPQSSAISNHARARVWPITDYDGANIPYPDHSFDIVYSSNVLEHVEELDELDQEIQRVLRKGGHAIHLIPNPKWRAISLLTYYPGQAIDGLRLVRKRFGSAVIEANGSANAPNIQPSKNVVGKIMARILPPTHGSRGTAFSELWRYSKKNWDHFFTKAGWHIIQYGNNGLWASGDYLLGSQLSLTLRRHLGRAIGGIAHVYILGKSES